MLALTRRCLGEEIAVRAFRICMLVYLLGVCPINGSQASPVTFAFTGSVTNDPFGLSSFGAPITGSYTFDSAAVDAIPGPSTGSYPSIGLLFGFLANVDGTPYSVSGSIAINTANNIGVGLDQYGALSTDGLLTLELFLQDASQTALSSDALPLVPPPLAAFDVREFRLFSPDAEFIGTVNTLVCSAGCGPGGGGGQVPEPDTILLLLVCILLMPLTIRRRMFCQTDSSYKNKILGDNLQRVR